MAYKFKASKCMNCGEKLSVDKDTSIEERSGGVIGYCPNCLVANEMVEVEGE